MKVVLTPLNPDYKTVQIRATELENFHNCQFKYKYADKKFSNDDALHFGNVVHNMVQSYLFDPAKGRKGLSIICRQYPDHCAAIRSYFDLLSSQKQYHNIILSEFKNIVEFHLGDYKIIVEGTIDIVCHDETDNTYTIVDIKTSKAEWKPEIYDEKMQKFIYTYLFAQLVGRERVKSFDYVILTKHKTPRLQVMSCIPDKQNISDFFHQLLNSYVESLRTETFKARKHNGCRFCPLRSEGTCPEWPKGTAF